MINIALDQEIIVAGDRISGHLTCTQPTELKQAQIDLFWRTEGRGKAEEASIVTLPIDLKQLNACQPIPFSFTTPYEGPITYDGALLRIFWEIRATLVSPGLMSKKETFSQPFTVIVRQAG